MNKLNLFFPCFFGGYSSFSTFFPTASIPLKALSPGLSFLSCFGCGVGGKVGFRNGVLDIMGKFTLG